VNTELRLIISNLCATKLTKDQIMDIRRIVRNDPSRNKLQLNPWRIRDPIKAPKRKSEGVMKSDFFNVL